MKKRAEEEDEEEGHILVRLNERRIRSVNKTLVLPS